MSGTKESQLSVSGEQTQILKHVGDSRILHNVNVGASAGGAEVVKKKRSHRGGKSADARKSAGAKITSEVLPEVIYRF